MPAPAFVLDAPRLANCLEERSCAAMVAVTLDGAVLYWNRAAATMFGRRSNDVLGLHVVEATALPEATHRSALREVREAGCTMFETHRTGPAGNRIRVTAWADHVAAAPGRDDFILMTYRDQVKRTRERSVRHHDGGSRLRVLTPRQRHVLQLIAEGLSTREIARRIGRSTKTVEAHRANLMKRLGERSLAGLIRLALHEGLADGEEHRPAES